MVSNTSDGPQLVGGRPCLDFINTEGAARNGPPERITSYDDLLSWTVHAGVLEEEEARPLATMRSAKVRDEVLERAIRFREAIYRIFAATLAREPAAEADRAILDAELGIAFSHRRLVPSDGSWRWEFEGTAVDSMLWGLAADAADLLVSEELDRVKQCSGDTCSWLFLDRSRNRSRRWCDMADCGNRSKARRHYARQKAES